MPPVRARARGDTPATSEAPPLVAVVNSELYAIGYANMEVRKYDKKIKAWATIRRLPRAASMDDRGLAFRACGDRLIVIGEPIAMGVGPSEVSSSDALSGTIFDESDQDALCITVLSWVADHEIFANRDRMASVS
uniref:Kelch repeat-containing F-box family protein n=1 Tax=Solanum tuberosum TaxID=4113 RepID=M0ZSW6_SOLTU